MTRPPRPDSHAFKPRRPDTLARALQRNSLPARLILILVLAAVAGCALMLLAGAVPLIAPRAAPIFSGWARRQNPWLSAFPLILGGTAYIALQAILKPRPLELLKRLMLGAAFLLWGVVQLMPPGDLATELGDLVIALYVIDLALMIRSDLHGVS